MRIKKGRVGRRPRIWASLTAAGRRAVEAHMAALSEIATSMSSASRPVAVLSVADDAAGSLATSGSVSESKRR